MTKVYDARSKPFQLYGLHKPEEQGLFKRMPLEVAEKTSERVKLLYTNTAGARIRFKTDSIHITVKTDYPPMEFSSPQTAAKCSLGAYSFDLYADNKFCRVLTPKELMQEGSINHFVVQNEEYEGYYEFKEKRIREITLYFPSFVNIRNVQIGLDEDAIVEEGGQYVNDKQIVFYGSSITQGACASRAGNTYENILSRRMNFDYLNLGFASGAKAEDAIIDYLGTLDMSVLVFDYDHNTKTPQHLAKTHYPALERFRKAQPKTPIIMMSRPNQCFGKEDSEARVKVIQESHQKLMEQGDKNVHFINGQEIYLSHDSEMMTIDDTHPTDFGFYCIAEALEKVLRLYI